MNSSLQNTLQPAFSELNDTLADLYSASGNSLNPLLRRLVSLLHTQPLADFIANALPKVEFDVWWKSVRMTGGSMAGSGSLDWPPLRADRVAMQLALCRALDDGRVKFHDLVLHFLYAGTSNISAHVRQFAEVIVAPMIRDLMRLAENRALPQPLSAVGASLPTDDPVLNQLLREAMNYFRDPAPAARRQAAERLWDAWERLKSLDEPGDKRRSTERLLAGAADEPRFRKLLDIEARTLTDIGNQFHIRHFESDRRPLNRPEHYDYLFHRLWALIELLLRSRAPERRPSW